MKLNLQASKYSDGKFELFSQGLKGLEKHLDSISFVNFGKNFTNSMGGRSKIIIDLKGSKFDDLVKSLESRHSCESRSPELPELTGFPLSRE